MLPNIQCTQLNIGLNFAGSSCGSKVTLQNLLVTISATHGYVHKLEVAAFIRTTRFLDEGLALTRVYYSESNCDLPRKVFLFEG